MSDNAPSPNLRRAFVAIALLSGAVLLFEIAVTRILSVVLWYHWAFLCISLAMLGLGAPGVWFSLARRPIKLLPHLLLSSAVLLPVSIVLICKLGRLFRTHGALFAMPCILLPMLCLGAAICLLLIQAEGRTIGRMYGFDLVGACVAALVIIPLLHLFPTPELVGAIGLLPLIAHVILSRRISTAAVVIAVALVAAIAWREPFALHYTKTYEETRQSKPIHEKWTPTTRLTFFDSIFFVAQKHTGFAWGRGSKARPVPVEQYWIEQDGCAGTPITRFNGNIKSLGFLFDDVTTIAYQATSPRAVAIVGAGGGRDILSSLLGGAKDVDAVEINPHIVRILSSRFRQFAGDVYHLPGVNPIVSEGRSFLASTKKRYDLIQVSLIDTWASTTAGAYALSENNLYTLEALELYLRRLSDNGLLSISRWVTIEVPRLVVMAKEALRQVGYTNPNDHIAVVQGGYIATVLLSRQPFSPRTISALVATCQRRGFTLLFPKTVIAPRESLVAEILDRGPQFLRQQGLNVEPPRDDKPFFFFHMLSPFGLLNKRVAERYNIKTEPIRILQVLMIAMAIATLALFFLPFALFRWFKRHPGYWRGSAYFVCIGIAFMLVEIPWLQKFILYLGHPSYATTVVLASLLLGAGLGSISSARIGLHRVQRAGILLPLLLGGVNIALSAVFSATLGYAIWLRVAISFLLLSPVGLVMGLFFPLGMMRFGDGNKPWFWAMNGAAGVLSSVSSLSLAMEFGFTHVATVGAAFYVGAWLLLQGTAVREVSSP